VLYDFPIVDRIIYFVLLKMVKFHVVILTLILLKTVVVQNKPS